MELTKREFLVLWAIEEGAGFVEEVPLQESIGEEGIKKTFEKLRNLGIISLTKKYDEYYKKENWLANIIDKQKARELYKKYKDWIPDEN